MATGDHSVNKKVNLVRIEDEMTDNDIGFDDVHIIVEDNEDVKECPIKKKRKISSNVTIRSNVEGKE